MAGVILAIGAHPDDIEIGCGGTLKQYINKGAKVYGLILTRGQNGKHSQDCLECQNSVEFLGLTEFSVLKFRDGFLKHNTKVVLSVEEFIKKYQPDEIYVHHPEDTHQDHEIASKVTRSAARRSNSTFIYYQSLSTDITKFSPTIFSVITNTIEDKLNALRKYTSQLERDSIVDLDRIKAQALYWGHKTLNGNKMKVDYVEAFQLFKEVRR